MQKNSERILKDEENKPFKTGKKKLLVLWVMCLLLPMSIFILRSAEAKGNQETESLESEVVEVSELETSEAAELGSPQETVAVDSETVQASGSENPTEESLPEEQIENPVESNPQQAPEGLKSPALYIEKVPIVQPTEKTVYLTFDDGPTKYTDQILDVLAKHGVHATFYVVGSQVVKYPETVKRIVDEGHAIGLHSYSHDYEKVYASVDSFLQEYEKALMEIQKITDYPVTTIRFPGGTNNNFATEIAAEIVTEMTNRGYAIFDWNVDSGDTTETSPEQITENIVSGCESISSDPIVLMHDTKEATAKSLDATITELKSLGYQFGVLSNAIEPMYFSVE